MLLGHHAGTSTSAAASRHLGLKDFEEAGIRVAERRFRAGDTIFSPGDPDGQLHFLPGGVVRLYKIHGEYKEATVALLKDGGVFGEALTDVCVAVVRKTILNEVIKRRPEFAMKLFFYFSERLKQSDEVIDSLLDREVSARLATLLSNLGARFGEADGSGTVIDMRLTQQDLANMIFSTREAVLKVMGEFQRDGVIETHSRRIIVNPQLTRAS